MSAVNGGMVNLSALREEGHLGGAAGLMRRMLSVPGFLRHDVAGRGIEVKPGRFAPVDAPSRVAIVDDVLASGRSAAQQALARLHAPPVEARMVVVLSYGQDRLIEEKYGVEVRALYQVDDLLNALDPESAAMLTPPVRAFQDRLRSVIAS